MEKVLIDEPIYMVELNAGYDGHGTQIEQFLFEKLRKYENQVITWSVMILIESEIKRAHEDFIKLSPRLKKDVNYQYHISKSSYSDFVYIALGSRYGAASIRFKPIHNILTSEGLLNLPEKEVTNE